MIKIICSRVSVPEINIARGDVISVIDGNTYEGSKVATVGGKFTRLLITDMDLDDELIGPLQDRTKKLIIPPTESHVYQELLTQGFYTGTKSELEGYIVDG